MENIKHLRSEEFATWLDEGKWLECMRCPLCAERAKLPVFGRGNPKSRLMLIGDAPGEKEDLEGKAFVGRSGQLLFETLYRLGMTDEDIYVTNTVACRPTDNRDPLSKEITACKERLHAEIYHVDPVLIVSLGSIATKALAGPSAAITQLEGKLVWINIPSRVSKTEPLVYPLLPTRHPSFVLRKCGSGGPERASIIARQYPTRMGESQDFAVRLLWHLYMAHIFRMDAIARESGSPDSPAAVETFIRLLPKRIGS